MGIYTEISRDTSRCRETCEGYIMQIEGYVRRRGYEL